MKEFFSSQKQIAIFKKKSFTLNNNDGNLWTVGYQETSASNLGIANQWCTTDNEQRHSHTVFGCRDARQNET